MSDIVMPKLSDTMTEGRLVSWKKRVGETVRRGDVLAEVETDKANMELEAFVSGELLEIKVEAGEMASVGAVIAVIGKAAEKGGQPAQPAAAAPPKAEPAAGAPPAAPAAAEAKPAPAVAEPKLAEAEAKAAPTVSEAAGTKPPEVPGPSDFKQDEAQAPVAPLAPATGEAQAAPVSPTRPALLPPLTSLPSLKRRTPKPRLRRKAASGRRRWCAAERGNLASSCLRSRGAGRMVASCCRIWSSARPRRSSRGSRSRPSPGPHPPLLPLLQTGRQQGRAPRLCPDFGPPLPKPSANRGARYRISP